MFSLFVITLVVSLGCQLMPRSLPPDVILIRRRISCACAESLRYSGEQWFAIARS
ncbi:MAG: hypothetical protein IPN71_12300 [Fibrobacteres bacterium]|nr:hypothetical protein [Fibrobacterota bacterium]